MKLAEAVDLSQPLALSVLTSDVELVRDIQAQLKLFGLLDPPVDGKFGAVSCWALQQFNLACGIDQQPLFTANTAKALLSQNTDKLFPLAPAADLAGQIAAAMLRCGHWISRHPACCNIIYIEGLDADGNANDNAPNEFNDLRLILKVGEHGVPEISKSWVATTEPGKFWTEHPMDRAGAARIAFGQYKSWVVGLHHPNSPGAHEALVQAEDITICRDLNKDYEREGDRKYTGLFAVNQHWGYDLPKDNLGKSSAGCLVGRAKAGHLEFMKLVKSDPRYAANHGYRFMTTVMPASALIEAAFDPMNPH